MHGVDDAVSLAKVRRVAHVVSVRALNFRELWHSCDVSFSLFSDLNSLEMILDMLLLVRRVNLALNHAYISGSLVSVHVLNCDKLVLLVQPRRISEGYLGLSDPTLKAIQYTVLTRSCPRRLLLPSLISPLICALVANNILMLRVLFAMVNVLLLGPFIVI